MKTEKGVITLIFLVLIIYTFYLLIFAGNQKCHAYDSNVYDAEAAAANHLCYINTNVFYILKAFLIIALTFEIFIIYKLLFFKWKK